MSYKEFCYFKKLIGDLKRLEQFRQLDNGTYMIPVGEDGILNIIVFTNGEYLNPNVSKVITIDINNETELAERRDEVYLSERVGNRVWEENPKLFKVNFSINSSFEQYERNQREKTTNNNGVENRTRDSNWSKEIRERKSTIKDNKGNYISVGQEDYFYDTVVRDEKGRIKVIYHGTNNEFNIFDISKVGSSSGTSFGYGFYYTDSENIAKGYGAKYMKTGYLNITKPLSLDSKTINKQQLAKFLKAIDSTGEGVLSNFDDVSYYGYSRVLNKAINNLLEYNDNDVDIICEIANIDGVARSQKYWDTLKKVLGYNGIIIDNYNNTGTTVRYSKNLDCLEADI